MYTFGIPIKAPETTTRKPEQSACALGICYLFRSLHFLGVCYSKDEQYDYYFCGIDDE